MRLIRRAALFLTALLTVAPGASHARQEPRRVAPAVFLPRSALLRPPVLAKRGGKWALTFRMTGDVLSLEQGQTTPGARPILPVSLHPGTWLPGRLLPGGVIEVSLGDAELASLLPGKNEITIQVPGWQFVKGVFDSAPLLKSDADLRAFAAARLRTLPLPDALLTPDTAWQTWRDGTPQETAATHPLLEGLESAKELTLAAYPGLFFANPGRKVLALSSRLGHSSATLQVPGKARKLYLLLRAWPESRDSSEPFARIAVRCLDGELITRELRNPNRAHPSEKAEEGEGLKAMEVADLDLGEMRGVESITIETIGRNSALALVGVTALGAVKASSLAGLSPRLRAIAQVESPTLFSFDTPSLAGWEIIGSGWGTTDTVGEFFMRRGTSRYFADSKANGGETATGTILSPPFTITGSQVTFLANGHSKKNYFALVNAADGKELVRAPAPEKTGPFVKIVWDTQALKGRVVRFKAVDDDNRDAYAWIAFDDIEQVP